MRAGDGDAALEAHQLGSSRRARRPDAPCTRGLHLGCRRHAVEVTTACAPAMCAASCRCGPRHRVRPAAASRRWRSGPSPTHGSPGSAGLRRWRSCGAAMRRVDVLDACFMRAPASRFRRDARGGVRRPAPAWLASPARPGVQAAQRFGQLAGVSSACGRWTAAPCCASRRRCRAGGRVLTTSGTRIAHAARRVAHGDGTGAQTSSRTPPGAAACRR